MADRSSDSIGRPGSNWTVDGPSKSPAKSPRTRRASAWATSRPSLRSSSTVEPAKGRLGFQHRVNDHRQDRRRVLAPGGVERGIERGALGRSEHAAERGLCKRCEQAEPPCSYLRLP